jgi:hypothetical protein
MPQEEWLIACGNLAVLWWQLQLAGLEDLDDLQTYISTARIFLEEHKAPDAAAAELSELAKELHQDSKLAQQIDLGARTLDPEMSIQDRLNRLIGEWSDFQAVEETIDAVELRGEWNSPRRH